MTTNREKAAEIIEGYYPECPNCPVGIQEVGECSECARICKVIADALDAAGVLVPDVEPDRVHAIGGVTIIETGSDRTSVTTWGGVVTILDEVAGDLAYHSPELAAENAMTIEEVDGMIAALTHARTISAHAQKEETNE